MTTQALSFKSIDPAWMDCISRGLAEIDPAYLSQLTHSDKWLPGHEKIFNAFSLPFHRVNYVLFGESPYPRSESANGYAFWDAAVHDIWSPTGLSKKVNRATSLRNIIKMLLIAEGVLDKDHTDQESISKINKDAFVQTNEAFFNNFLKHGFLLLNATPVLQSDLPQKDAKAWSPFIKELMHCLFQNRPNVKLILFGRIANTIDALLPNGNISKLYAEHPYNLSFVTNQDVIDFFRPLHLLRK